MNSLLLTVLFLAAMALICAIGAYAVWLHSRLIHRLRSAHHVLWLDLGAPRLPAIIFQYSYQNALRITGERIMYVGWLRDKYYEQLKDPEVTVLALRLCNVFWAFVAWLIIFVGGVILLARYY
jgi:hypothetical protein